MTRDHVFHGNDGDAAGGQPRRITLSAPGVLTDICCKLPGLLLFTLAGLLVASAFFCPPAFFGLTAALTFYVGVWSMNLSLSSCWGARLLRRDTAKDWHAILRAFQQRRPAESEATHIVILPNYKEDKTMLLETLQNIARSPMAKEHVRVVLAMEAREGEAALRKANQLIQETSGLFAEVIATFHPEDLPGEVKGKSSNTQWGLQEALNRFSPFLSTCDPSRVFITVGDADTQWHPQYLSALAVNGLEMPPEQRAWTIWQPPVLLLRNLWTVPGFTRVSGFATIMFELAGLANQVLGTHLCYSAYSLTMALAIHRCVRGWDADVIAEDHHMFCKCYFASMWETVEGLKAGGKDATPVVPKVQLSPIYLPAVSYLVESSEGYWASCVARFQQARRHSQGIAEVSYILLQYFHLIAAVGVRRLPLLTHLKVLGIAWRLSTVHIINSVQAMSLVLTGALCAWWGICWLAMSGMALLANGSLAALCEVGHAAVQSFIGRMVVCMVGPFQIFAFLASLSSFIVTKDCLEGRYKQFKQEEKLRPATAWSRLKLFLQVQSDMYSLSEPTIMLYGMIPATMAVSSLFWRGTKFDYIVAAKPESG
jgi:hypothetical protein